MTNIKVDDLVQIDPLVGKFSGQVFRVTAVPGGRRKNVSAVPVSGSGQGVKGDPTLFVLPGDSRWVPTDRNVETPPVATLVAYESPRLVLGSVFRIHGRDGLWVALGETAGKWRAAKLGGDDNRYLRGVVSSMVAEVLDPAALQLG